MWRGAGIVLSIALATLILTTAGCTPFAYTFHKSASSAAAAQAPNGTSAKAPAPVRSAGSEADKVPPPSGTRSEVSKALTNYFQHNRLPLVGAHIAAAPDGRRQVILYGFVATEHGKQDAERRARKFLQDPDIKVENRIIVRPELAEAKSKTADSGALASNAPSSSPDSSIGSLQQYKEQQNQLQQYQNQAQQYRRQEPLYSLMNMLLPLVGMALMAGSSYGTVGIYPGMPSYMPPAYRSPFSTYPTYPAYPTYPTPTYPYPPYPYP